MSDTKEILEWKELQSPYYILPLEQFRYGISFSVANDIPITSKAANVHMFYNGASINFVTALPVEIDHLFMRVVSILCADIFKDEISPLDEILFEERAVTFEVLTRYFGAFLPKMKKCWLETVSGMLIVQDNIVVDLIQ